MMEKLSPPACSVIFVAANGQNLRELMSKLSEQTIRNVLEVVIVLPEEAETMMTVKEQGSTALHSCRIVSCGPRTSPASALAIGIRQASAPVVALIEDHCFPEPGWAEALLKRHGEGYAVVGPEISNANHESSISWCSFLLTHGAWSPPATAGEIDAVAADNSSYRRDVILAVGEELDTLLASGTVLHWQLRDAGHKVFLEPKAKATHISPSRLHSFVGSRFHNGRTFAGLWSRHWSWSRRLYFAAISPLIALRRVIEVRQLVRRRKIPVSMLRVIPLLSMALVASSLGYLAGFLGGPGRSAGFSSDLYFQRDRHLRKGDRGLAPVLRSQKPPMG